MLARNTRLKNTATNTTGLRVKASLYLPPNIDEQIDVTTVEPAAALDRLSLNQANFNSENQLIKVHHKVDNSLKLGWWQHSSFINQKLGACNIKAGSYFAPILSVNYNQTMDSN